MLNELKYVYLSCPICDSKRSNVLYPDTLGNDLPRLGYDFSPEHNRTYRIVQCLDCTHAYASPLPEKLWKKYKEIEDLVYLSNSKQRMITAVEVLRRIRKYLPRGRLLDIGCGTGDFMLSAREFYDVEGIELSHWSANIARDKGLKVFDCQLHELVINEYYDVATLWGVIEHLENPKHEIESIRRLIKPGGLVCLWTGDFSSFPSRLLREKWWWVQGQHIQYFSRKSLIKLFKDQYFEHVYFGIYPYVMTMQSIAKSLARYKMLGKIVKKYFNVPFIRNINIKISLPGEMFVIFRKAT
jgi:ubiquinone/menaquinone biosynthesis C-methylase UbiE